MTCFFPPMGKQVLIATFSTVRLFNCVDGRLIATLLTGADRTYHSGIGFFQSGKYPAISLPYENAIRVVRCENGEMVASTNWSGPKSTFVATYPLYHRLAIGDDGALVALGDEFGVRVIDVQSGRTLWSTDDGQRH